MKVDVVESSTWNPVKPSVWLRFRWWFLSGGLTLVAVIVLLAIVLPSSPKSQSTSTKVASSLGGGPSARSASGVGGSSSSTTQSSTTSGSSTTSQSIDPSAVTSGTTFGQLGAPSSGFTSGQVSSALAITTTSLPPAEVGQPYSANLQAAGASGGVSWSLPSGGLPAGLSLSASGAIAGTPAAGGAGATAPLFVVTDSQGDTTEAAVPLAVVGAPVLYTPNLNLANPPGFAPKASVPASVDIGASYQATWVISEYSGVPNYSWSIASGSLPPGVTNPKCTDAPQCLNAYSSGTPTSTGTFTFDVRVTDAHGVTGNQTDTVVVNPAPTITTTSLPAASADNSYSTAVELSGGTGPYSWSISGPSLANLSVTGTSALATISTGGRALSLAPGSYPVTVSVQDSEGLNSSVNLALNVGSLPQLVITPTSLPGADQGVTYHASLNASGGSGSGYTWSATGLPLGVGLAPTGSFSGSPTETGSYPVTITATDGAGNTVSATETLLVASPPTILTTSLPLGTATVAYSPVTLQATGGVPNVISGFSFYTWAAAGLPQGMSLDPNAGVLSGTPLSAGNFNVRVTVTDTVGGTQSILLYLTVASAPPPSTTTTTTTTGGNTNGG